MVGIEMNYEDIKNIFKENLKIESLIKSIQSIFLNPRFTEKIDYKPYFQRNYVWDDEKATYFIESVLLGTEIPPLVFFQTKNKNEIIDGRQRYETIQRFIQDKLVLKESGLHNLKKLSGKKYSNLTEKTKEVFETTKLRILQCSVVNEPKLDEIREDKIKKEIFRRYNSGITPLQKEEISRAEYIDDSMTKKLKIELEKDYNLYDFMSIIFLPKRKRNINKRDKINIIITKIRTLLTLPYIPIYSYAHANSKTDIIRKYYYGKIVSLDEKLLVDNFKKVILNLQYFYNYMNSSLYKENTLVYECVFWAIYIVIQNKKEVKKEDIQALSRLFNETDNKIPKYMWNNIQSEFCELRTVFEQSGSHYYNAIFNRYQFISNYFQHLYSTNYKQKLKENSEFKKFMDSYDENTEIEHYKLNKSDPESVTIYDIVQEMKKNRFLIRPEYQRSEVVNQQKSSYLLESMMLGIKIPPLFIYKRKDSVKEVIDGQQRLLSLIGFLGKTYLNENGKEEKSKKDCFKLTKLRILDNLNGRNINNLKPKYEDKLWDFALDIVEIDQDKNPDFNSIDLFLRLNTKPYPIKDNTFEMWNAYIDKNIILRVKSIAEQYDGKIFRPKDTRMKNEELIASLGYLEYKFIIDSIEPKELLDIYIRNNKLSGRIKKKEYVTKVLCEVTEHKDRRFLTALNKVEDFIKKITILVDKEYSNLGLLFGTKKGIQSKTDQNFYFLWLMLHNVSLTQIRKNRGTYSDLIKNEYKKIQKLEENVNVNDVIKNMEILLK